jgi:hypothetical protein
MKAQAPLQARDALLAAPYSFIAQSALQPRETVGFPTAMKDGLELFAKLPVLSVSSSLSELKI